MGWLVSFFFLHKGKITTVFMLVGKIQYKAGWAGEWQKLVRDRKRENGQGNVHKETRWDLV